MYTSPAYSGTATRDQTATLFGQTMGLVALTAAVFALGAYAGRHLSEGAAIGAWIGAFVVLMIMNFAARKSAPLATVLLVSLYRTPESLEAAWKYFILCGVGIAQALFGTILLYFAAEKLLGAGGGALLWTELNNVKSELEPTVLSLAPPSSWTPTLALPRALPPVTSTPMKLPSIKLFSTGSPPTSSPANMPS